MKNLLQFGNIKMTISKTSGVLSPTHPHFINTTIGLSEDENKKRVI